MKFGVVNKSTIVYRIVLHTLKPNITNLAVKTCKTNIRLGILKEGTAKEPKFFLYGCQPGVEYHYSCFHSSKRYD